MIDRIAAVRARFDELGIRAFVVSSRPNTRYLTGFSGSNGTLAVTDDRATLITDSRYEERAADELAAGGTVGVDIVCRRDTDAALTEVLEPGDPIGLEADEISWARLDSLRERFTALRPTTGVVESLRERKTDEELDAIRRAAEMADLALADVRPLLADRPTERQVAGALDEAMRRHGADRPGYGTIVASGPNAARPHHEPGTRPIDRGDLVIIDVGAEVDGYRSDMTRSFVIGTPTET